MQAYIDNWSSALLAGVGSGAEVLQIPAVDAARLVELAAGKFYELTLVELDGDGLEVAWEVVQATARSGGAVTVTRSAGRNWAAGALVEARFTAAAAQRLQAGGVELSDEAPQGLGNAAPGASSQAARGDHVHPLPTAADIGAATASQGELAETAIQPDALSEGLADKVDKLTGYGLSQEDFTSDEKAKLASLDEAHYKGTFPNLAALEDALPTAAPGNYADVDAGVGDPVLRYIWDDSDAEWVPQAGSAAPVTAAQVKALYESNADTNAYSNAEKAKLGGVAAGATANADTDSLAEGASNKYFTDARVRSVLLAGLSVVTGGAITNADSVLVAVGKLQKQITDLVSAVAGKQDALVSGTNIKSINGTSLLGAGNLTIAMGPDPVTTVAGTSATAALADIGTYQRWTNTGAKAYTVPPQSTVAWTADAQITIRNAAAGNLTLTPGSGVSLNAPYLGTLVVPPGGTVVLKRGAADVWDVLGATVAA